MSELKPVEGIDIVGPLPDELQKITIFSAGIASVSKEPDAGKALIKFLASPAARAEIVKSGHGPDSGGGDELGSVSAQQLEHRSDGIGTGL